MNIQENQNIGELVARDYRVASVFKKYGIDFCCQGNRSIKDACDKKNIAPESVVSDLNEAVSVKASGEIDYTSWPLDLLADYVEKKHHRYVEEKSLEIQPYLDKICRVHGERHPELLEINSLFKEGVGELAAHMKKEELILFPFIRKMANTKTTIDSENKPHFGTVQNPIEMMMHEHTAEGERYRKIEELSNNYTPPEDACGTYRVTFGMLEEFEKDLHLHIHLENNILFPKAIELEKSILV